MQSETIPSEVFAVISDKWSVLVLMVLRDETRRFGEIGPLIGKISHRMLATSLRRLKHEGLVDRKVYATVPPRVEYTISTLGRELLLLVEQICRWPSRAAGVVGLCR